MATVVSSVTDQEIAEALDTLFRETNPYSFTSLNDVVLRLQSRLRCRDGGFDLAHKLDFIRAHIALFFSPPTPPPPPPPPSGHGHGHVFTPVVAQSQYEGFVMPRHVREISFAQPPPLAKMGGANVGQVKASAKSKPKRRGSAGGLAKLCSLSPQLEAVVGSPSLPRTEIAKQLWAYIKKNNLQDPSNKRKIICNDELRLVFETDSTDMFKMNKLLSKHITPLVLPKYSGSGERSNKVKTEDADVQSTEPNPVVISEALANFFGATDREMLQSEVTRRFSEYIKIHGLELQDPFNSVVVCDAKLQELFGCESIPSVEIYDTLVGDHLSWGS